MISVITSNPGSGLTQLIKDFQEVDLYQTASSKPFPNDLFVQVDGEVPKTSIKGDFLVQIASIQLANPLHDDQTFLLTITDGIQTVHALTNGSIANLKTHGKIGSKLLLTDTIAIQEGYLQLNGDNTQFHYGSNTYPRPRSAFRGRTAYRNGGTSRPNGDGRRNHRYDNEDGETSFVKRPPPKTTLIDFMPQLKISVDSENEKTKERNGKRRNNTNETTNHSSKDQIVYEQDIVNDETADNDDDPTHGAFRERRNPLPPRLQRVQEERSRRNPTRFTDEIAMFNDIYPGDPTGMSYLAGNSSTHNPFVSHPNLIGSTATPLAYLPYGLTPMATQGYPTDQTNFHYGTTSVGPAPPTYFVAPTTLMSNGNSTENSSNENEEKRKSSEEQNDENNEQTKKSSSDEKRRETTSRPRWKVGDFCLARWNEDGEFYYATVLQIQPPFCNIVFTEYNTHDKVHFNDMKVVPRDQHYYEYYPPSLVSTSEYNPYITNGCYPIGLDGCLIMPEVPPFPFNSDGTLYMCPTPLTTSFTRSAQQPQQQRRRDQTNSTAAIKDDEISDGSSSLSKAKPCSIADSPLVLVTSDDLRENSSKENN